MSRGGALQPLYAGRGIIQPDAWRAQGLCQAETSTQQSSRDWTGPLLFHCVCAGASAGGGRCPIQTAFGLRQNHTHALQGGAYKIRQKRPSCKPQSAEFHIVSPFETHKTAAAYEQMNCTTAACICQASVAPLVSRFCDTWRFSPVQPVKWCVFSFLQGAVLVSRADSPTDKRKAIVPGDRLDT